VSWRAHVEALADIKTTPTGPCAFIPFGIANLIGQARALEGAGCKVQGSGFSALEVDRVQLNLQVDRVQGLRPEPFNHRRGPSARTGCFCRS
jgi:hypothetical protein